MSLPSEERLRELRGEIVSRGIVTTGELLALLDAALVIRRLEAWLDQPGDHMSDRAHRITAQRSMSAGQWLVRLEVGPHGQGKCVWWGKGGPDLVHALRGGLDATEREPLDAVEQAR